DQIPDLAVSAPLDDAAGVDAGAVFVFFGPFTASPSPRLASSANAVFRGAAAGDHLGSSLVVRDVNGDGIADLLVGPPLNDAAGADAGAVYVLKGSATFASQSLASAVRLLGGGQQHHFGAAVAAGNVTGGSSADVIVGAPFEGASGGSSGCAYV